MKIAKIEVQYDSHKGTDLSIVNTARQSFAKRKEVMDKSDEGLIKYLALGFSSSAWDNLMIELANSNDPLVIDKIVREIKKTPVHWAPFASAVVTLKVKVPIWMSRQLMKHQIGLTWSEESRRYIDSEPEFWFPENYRARGENVKQGSSQTEFVDEGPDIGRDATYDALQTYNMLLDMNVAPEHARIHLPQNMMVNFDWTGSLVAWARIYNQRSGHGAQTDHDDFVHGVDLNIRDLYPHSWKALTA